MKDILRRLKSADAELAAELLARGAFSKSDVRELVRFVAREKPRARERATRERVEKKRAMIRGVAAHFLAGRRSPAWAFSPGFVPTLARADRQLAIHAVINCPMTDLELAQLSELTALQGQGHLIRQLRVAVELEIERRKKDGYRGGRNRIATKRG